MLCLELMSLEVKTQISGIVIVLDMKDLGFNHIMNVTTEHVKSIANVIQVISANF